MCPSSKAFDVLPLYILLFKIAPAPTPVLAVIKIILVVPTPAPNLYSANVAAFASLSKNTGNSNSSSKALTILKFLKGKFGGSTINPLLISNGPGDPIPIETTFSSLRSLLTYLILSFIFAHILYLLQLVL